MSNASVTNPNQELGTGDTRALALRMFAGRVYQQFAVSTVLWPQGMKFMKSSGGSHQFPFVGFMSARRHDPGTERTGSEQPPVEERTVAPDGKELETSAWISRPAEKISHYDLMEVMAPEVASSIGRELDSIAARMIALGARQDDRTGQTTTFSGGQRVWRNASTEAAAYPNTAEGAKRIRKDLRDLAQKFVEDNVPRGNWTATLSPYLVNVLANDQTLNSRDWDNGNANNAINRTITKVEGFAIKESIQLPGNSGASGVFDSTNESEAAYRGDFSKTAILATAHPMAFGSVMYGGIEIEGPEYFKVNRASFIGAAVLQGTKWLRPEACGEIHFGTSDYTATNGVYAP